MSAQNVIVSTIDNVVAADAVKQKKQTLAGKFSKLLNFGFWIASMTDSEDLKSQIHTQLRLFGTVEEQTELFERFSAEEKDIAKLIRKRIAEHNKPVKEPKTKAPRKGKAVVHQDELISQLIADANAEVVAEPKVPRTDDKSAKEAAKAAKEEAARLAKEAKEAARLAKTTKTVKETKATKVAKVAQVEASVVVNEIVDTAPVEVVAAQVDVPVVEDELVADVIEDLATMAIDAPKEVAKEEQTKTKKAAKKEPKPAKEPKAAKEPKTKTAKKPAEPAPPAEEEEEIQTRIATIGDKDFLIDQDFNVYNIEEPHDHIGTYNQETGAIDAL